MTKEDILARLDSFSESDRAEVLRLSQFLRPKPPSLLEFCRSSVKFDLRRWQEEHFIPRLAQWMATPGAKLAIHAPPQEGKSWITAQRLIAYILGRESEARVRLACFNIDRSARFGRSIVNLMQSKAYQDWAPQDAWIPRTASAESFYTPARSALNDAQPSFVALGLATGFVGDGCDYLIMDDPYASPQAARSPAVNTAVRDFYRETAVPRIESTAKVLCVFHRYHDADLAGELLSTGEWDLLRFPIEADKNEDGADPTGRKEGELLSDRHSREWVEKIKAEDPSTFYSMFQGTPLPTEGRIFNREDFQIIEPHECPELEHWYRGYDTATSIKQSADFYAGALIGVDADLTIYIKDLTRFKKEFPDARKEIINTALMDGAGVPIGIEDKVAGLAMAQDLMRVQELLGYTLYPMPVNGDKKQRASAWAARARIGKLKLVRGPWNQWFINECLAFDGLGLAHDDGVDAVSTAFGLLHFIQGGTASAERTFEPNTHAYWIEMAKIMGVRQGDDDEFEDY